MNKNNQKSFHRILLSITCSLTLTVFSGQPLQAADEKPAKQAPPAMPVTVVNPEMRMITEWNEFTGRFEASQRVEIRSLVSGYLQEIHFTDGQYVEKNDLLFTIDPRTFEATLAANKAELLRAETQYSLAKQELKRARRLIKRKAISQEEFDERSSGARTAQASIAAAKAAIRNAELDLEYSKIIAPISGRISSRKIDVGNLIQLGGVQILTTILAETPVYFNFDVSESDYLQYIRRNPTAEKQPMIDKTLQIEVKLLDEKDFTHKGQLEFIDTHLDGATGTIRIRASFADTDRGLLLPGVFGRGRISLGDPAPVLLVPDKAIFSDMNNKIIMTVNDQDLVEPRKVVLGPIYDGLRIIRSGVTEQDRIITEGLLRARPGAKVAPHEKAPQETAKTVEKQP